MFALSQPRGVRKHANGIGGRSTDFGVSDYYVFCPSKAQLNIKWPASIAIELSNSNI